MSWGVWGEAVAVCEGGGIAASSGQARTFHRYPVSGGSSQVFPDRAGSWGGLLCIVRLVTQGKRGLGIGSWCLGSLPEVLAQAAKPQDLPPLVLFL